MKPDEEKKHLENPQTLPVEIEIKYHIPFPTTIREQLLRLDLRREGPFFETNRRFEDAKSGLLRRNCLLRLRSANRCTLTWKSPPEKTDTEFKTLQEVEVEISDPEAMTQILSCLGFRAVQVYEKYRETFFFTDAQCCLDRMPYGDFLEIEGSRDAIRRISSQLGLDWHRRILFNYLEIFEMIKRSMALPFDDVTFTNFHDLSVDIKKILTVTDSGIGNSGAGTPKR